MLIDNTYITDDRPSTDELSAITNAPCLERAEAAFVDMHADKTAFIMTLCEAGLFINSELYEQFAPAVIFGKLGWIPGAYATKKRHEALLRQVHANFAMRINHSHDAMSSYIANDPQLYEARKRKLLDSLWFAQHGQLEAIQIELDSAMAYYSQALALLQAMAWRSVRQRPQRIAIRLVTPLAEQVTWLEGLVAGHRKPDLVVPTSFRQSLDAPVALARWRKRRKPPLPTWWLSLKYRAQGPKA